MFFFEDFCKRVEKTTVEPKDIEKFRLDIKKVIMWLGTGVPLLLMGLYQGYMFYLNSTKYAYLVFSIIFIYLGLKHLKTIFEFGITLNLKEGKIISKGVDLSFDDIQSCTLKEQSVGKSSRAQVVIDIITKEKKEIIIPLMMGRKLIFIAILRDKLKNRFRIVKG